MKVFTETSLKDFEAWSGGKNSLDILIGTTHAIPILSNSIIQKRTSISVLVQDSHNRMTDFKFVF